MILGENVGSVYTKGKEIQKVYSKGKLVWQKEPIDYSVMPFTIKAVEKMYVNVGKSKNPNTDKRPKTDFKYSINGGEWVNTTAEFISINLNSGDKISIISDVDYCYPSGVCDVYGNIMSLLYGENFIGQTVWKSRIYYYGNSGFFDGSGIRHAENLILPATTLTEKCYRNMFSGCLSLITAPALPATILASNCYERMFYNCPLLTKAPELPATTLVYECYHYMFYGCSKLDYIKCHAVQTENDWGDVVDEWLSHTATTGKLLCKQVDGGKNPLEDTIPSTWTVEYF